MLLNCYVRRSSAGTILYRLIEPLKSCLGSAWILLVKVGLGPLCSQGMVLEAVV